jgi:hypothetical protein
VGGWARIPYVRQLLPLTCLAPDIFEGVSTGGSRRGSGSPRCWGTGRWPGTNSGASGFLQEHSVAAPLGTHQGLRGAGSRSRMAGECGQRRGAGLSGGHLDQVYWCRPKGDLQHQAAALGRRWHGMRPWFRPRSAPGRRRRLTRRRSRSSIVLAGRRHPEIAVSKIALIGRVRTTIARLREGALSLRA